jgi:O-antigen/teichoic acid export membrane protein
VITLFSFLNSAQGASTSRFLTFELGRNDRDRLKKVFRTAFNIHAALAIIVVVFCETAGLWIVNNVLVIPPERLFACNVIYQYVVVSALLSITQAPMNAQIIAHERMGVYAYTSIADAVLKLAVAYLITVSTFDRLVTLGSLNLCISFGMYIFYHIYCKKRFAEYNFGLKTDRKLNREMLNYSTWSLLGSTAFMLKNQGINILINIFFGPVINAANAIAYQVNQAVVQFSNNFTTALNPQIIKTYAADKKAQMKNLIFRGGRFSFFLLMLLSIPVLLETNIILKLWLKTVPDYTVALTRLILLLALIESFAITISIGIQATGQIKYYQIFVGCIYLLNFPIAFLFYKSGAKPTAALTISIVLALINMFVRLYFLKKYTCIGMFDFVKSVLWVSATVMVASCILPAAIYELMNEGVLRFFAVLAVSFFSSAVSVYLLGLQKMERQKINIYISNKLNQIKIEKMMIKKTIYLSLLTILIYLVIKTGIDKNDLKCENAVLYRRIDNFQSPDNGLHTFHFSMDDVIKIFEDLTKNEQKYNSMFENETLGFFGDLHKKYGLVLSCYCYFEDGNFQLSQATRKFKKEFEENSNWLKFGFHGLNGNVRYENESAEKAANDYEKVISALIQTVGEISIDHIPRIHYYSGNRQVIDAFRNADYGITGLLGADDDRVQYYFNEQERIKIRNSDCLYDSIMHLKIFSTDLRMEKIEDMDVIQDSVRMNQLISGNNILVCFTHEWALNRKIKNNIIKYCDYAVFNKYKFDFPDKIQISKEK